MRLLRILLIGTAFLWSSPLVAQPLYLGEQEIDTADRGAIAAIIRHCEELAAASGEADTRSAPITAEGHGPVEEPSNQDGFTSAIDLDALVSTGDGAEAAGEGAGTGVETEDRESDAGEGSEPDLSALTLEACKEAGIVY